MPIALNGDGSVTGITAGGYPNASVNTEDLNAGTASAGQKLVAGGATGVMSWGSSIVLGTAQNSTSGTAINFTGIPSWARRVTVMFNGVSTNGTSPIQIQIGSSGGFETSGYSGTNSVFASGVGTVTTSSGFLLTVSTTYTVAAGLHYGSLMMTLVSNNVWSITGGIGQPSTPYNFLTSGAKTLSGTLDRVRITTVNGTDTFDAGSINIMWE